MRRAAQAAALAGALVAMGCAAARPGGGRLSGPPRELEPGCLARGVGSPAPVEGRPASGRATFEFWVEADGSPGPIETVTWAEGVGLEGDAALANRVARAISRCAWTPGTVDGRPARALVRLPLRFLPSPEAEPEPATGERAREEIRPPQEVAPGCVPRSLPLPAGAPAGGVPRATFLVRVEADGSARSATAIARAPIEAEARRALAEAVAAAAAGCRFAPGTVNGEPARAFWLVEVRFTGTPPADPSP